MLTKKILAAALSCAALATAQAAETTKPLPPASTGLSPFLGIGLTFGGDQIGDDIQYESGHSSTVHAGGLVDLRAGLEYQAIGSPLSFQFSVGFHSDGSLAADNGSASFDRYPVEVLAHYRFNETWRVGGGVRKAFNAESEADGVGKQYVANQKFKSSTGLVLEAEVFFGPRVGLKLRAVNEEFTPESGASRKKIDGSHIGVIGAYYFK